MGGMEKARCRYSNNGKCSIIHKRGPRKGNPLIVISPGEIVSIGEGVEKISYLAQPVGYAGKDLISLIPVREGDDTTNVHVLAFNYRQEKRRGSILHPNSIVWWACNARVARERGIFELVYKDRY